jgi:alpha-beta hydrolase superfamily lysophospholipase
MPAEVEAVSFRSGDLDLYGRLRHRSEEAPAVVLLSGLGFHTFEYEPLATELAARGLNALSFDYRGHGRSGGPRGRWTLDELVADSRHAIDFVQARGSGPIMLFGNSLGAMIAIMAGAHDDRVLTVAAASCPARIGDFLLTWPRRALFAVAKLIGPLAPLRVSVDHFYAYEQLIDDPAWISTIRRDRLIADARRLSVPAFRALLEIWNGPGAVRELHKPLLVIQGRNDHLQPPRQSDLLFVAANDPKDHKLVDTGHLPISRPPRCSPVADRVAVGDQPVAMMNSRRCADRTAPRRAAGMAAQAGRAAACAPLLDPARHRQRRADPAPYPGRGSPAPGAGFKPEPREPYAPGRAPALAGCPSWRS